MAQSVTDLVDAVFLERTQQFVLRAWLPEEQEEALVHLGDPGRLMHLLTPGTALKLEGPINRPHRKTKYTALLAQHHNGTWVSLVIQLPNRLLYPLLYKGYLPHLWHPPLCTPELKREVAVGQSRMDAMLRFTGGLAPYYLECKSVTWSEHGVGLFPDAPTQRGSKHVQECIQLVHNGYRACILFVAGRSDIHSIRTARQIDPMFSDLLQRAALSGVYILGLSVKVGECGVHFERYVPVLLDSL